MMMSRAPSMANRHRHRWLLKTCSSNLQSQTSAHALETLIDAGSMIKRLTNILMIGREWALRALRDGKDWSATLMGRGRM